MIQELVFTSARAGLQVGKSGFCTVASTSGMAENLARLLESLSGYRHVYPAGSTSAEQNPVVYAHYISRVGGQAMHILSRVADAGLDYSNRSNKLAHHIVIPDSELGEGDPIGIMREPNQFVTSWDREPEKLAPRRVSGRHLMPAPCKTWEQVTGDAGWAGALIEAFHARQVIYVIVRPSTPALDMIAEALALLPAEDRWRATFSTFFTNLPPQAECLWRFVMDHSTEAVAASRNPNGRIITATISTAVSRNNYSTHAREGRSASNYHSGSIQDFDPRLDTPKVEGPGGVVPSDLSSKSTASLLLPAIAPPSGGYRKPFTSLSRPPEIPSGKKRSRHIEWVISAAIAICLGGFGVIMIAIIPKGATDAKLTDAMQRREPESVILEKNSTSQVPNSEHVNQHSFVQTPSNAVDEVKDPPENLKMAIEKRPNDAPTVIPEDKVSNAGQSLVKETGNLHLLAKDEPVPSVSEQLNSEAPNPKVAKLVLRVSPPASDEETKKSPKRIFTVRTIPMLDNATLVKNLNVELWPSNGYAITRKEEAYLINSVASSGGNPVAEINLVEGESDPFIFTVKVLDPRHQNIVKRFIKITSTSTETDFEPKGPQFVPLSQNWLKSSLTKISAEWKSHAPTDLKTILPARLFVLNSNQEVELLEANEFDYGSLEALKLLTARSPGYCRVFFDPLKKAHVAVLDLDSKLQMRNVFKRADLEDLLESLTDEMKSIMGVDGKPLSARDFQKAFDSSNRDLTPVKELELYLLREAMVRLSEHHSLVREVASAKLRFDRANKEGKEKASTELEVAEVKLAGAIQRWETNPLPSQQKLEDLMEGVVVFGFSVDGEATESGEWIWPFYVCNRDLGSLRETSMKAEKMATAIFNEVAQALRDIDAANGN